MQLKLRSLVKGAASRIPVVSGLVNSSTGGTNSARYCYLIWLRHLISVSQVRGLMRPGTVAELGPGDSMGVGLTAVVCGADRYYALDRLEFANREGNLAILDEVADLVRNRSPIPGDSEFPAAYPKLESYDFPHDLLDDDWLAHCLDPVRLGAIRHIVEGQAQSDSSIEIRYFAPWNSSAEIRKGSVDWIFSQAVLEHVDDVQDAYSSMAMWLHPEGVMSHQIDYTCHGLAHDWNGHWTAGDWMWRLVRGGRPYFINRLPHSAHIKAMESCGLRILKDTRFLAPPIERKTLAPGFADLSEADLETKGAFLVVAKA